MVPEAQPRGKVRTLLSMKTLAPVAREAGLVWVTDQLPGFRRVKRGKGFAYVQPDGRRLSDPKHLARIRSLAIPPAWTNVWICPFAEGHIQAIGRDARGRRQYRYHSLFRSARDEAKYHRLLAFGRLLPRVRRRIRHDLRLASLPREKVLATVVRLLQETHIRVGNEEYARQNHSYGLTTMKDHHARIRGSRILFQFRGKSGKHHAIEIDDPRLAKIVKRCQDLPGQELFQFLDAQGQVHNIGSADVNAYLRELTGGEFTAKDFRTWAGTVAAARILRAEVPCLSAAAGKRAIAACMRSVSERLGNTPAICRTSYVHPAVLDSYTCGELQELAQRVARKASRSKAMGGGLRADEALVLHLLKIRSSAHREA